MLALASTIGAAHDQLWGCRPASVPLKGVGPDPDTMDVQNPSLPPQRRALRLTASRRLLAAPAHMEQTSGSKMESAKSGLRRGVRL